jgi:alanine racemase
MIRFGISLYGLWPSKETYLSYLLSNPENSLLRPVLSWKSIVSQIKDVPAGEYIGYGCTYRATTDSRIALIPVGYFDGYDRKLSNLAHVLIRGKRAPVRGRICMDMFMVDVTHIPDVALEDEAVILGEQDNEKISADQLADWAGTINYEIVSRINPLLPRVIVD